MLVHLTNVAIQKQGVPHYVNKSISIGCNCVILLLQDDYNPHHGGKWSVDDLLFYIASLRGSEASDLLWQEICWVIGKQESSRKSFKYLKFFISMLLQVIR